MYDDAKNTVRTEALGHLTDIFELCYTECFSQGADHARIFLPWNHETPPGGSERSKSRSVDAGFVMIPRCSCDQGVSEHFVSITYVFFSAAARRNMVCPTANRPMRMTVP